MGVITSWDKGVNKMLWDVTPGEDGNKVFKVGMEALHLFWHHLTGVSALLLKPPIWATMTKVPGQVLADAVGVRKTGQVNGVITSIQQT
jgi:hypothetical protein